MGPRQGRTRWQEGCKNVSLYFVFTVDGDWDEYFLSKLSKAKRKPDKHILIELIKREIRISTSVNGKFVHFIHTSPVARDFFLKPGFISLWRNIKKRGGSVGVHCHEAYLFHDCRFNDQEKVDRTICDLTEPLASKGLAPISYRGGYLAFSEKNIPLLEKNGLFLDFSCEPDRYLWRDGMLVADWRGAPHNYYRMSYEDHRSPGDSKVIEIPLGKAGGGSLYLDETSLWGVWKAARALAKRDKQEEGDIIVFILTHTYEFSSFWKQFKIRLALLICKKYGVFISDGEALEIANRRKGKEEV